MTGRTGKPGSARSRKRGFALLMVMMLVMVLAIVVWSFQRDVARETSITANVRDDLSAAFLAQMGLVRGQAVLRLDEQADYDSLNETWSKPVTWEGETFGEAAAVEGEESTSAPRPSLLIVDEERRFNLLSLVRGNEEQRKKAIEVLTRLIRICRREDERLVLDGETRNVRRKDDQSVSTDMLVKNLVKYLEERASEDSEKLELTVREAENPDVRGMKKQTPWQMLTIGELLQVEGWTRELLYGPPRQVTEGAAAEPDDAAGKNWEALSDLEKFERKKSQIEDMDQRSQDPNPLGIAAFITLFSSGRININTCPREVLLALDERLTWDVVEQILTARDQDRQEMEAAEENGGTPPEEEPAAEGENTEEEEDKASFRTADLAGYQAFVNRANNQAQEGEEPATLEGFTEEIYTAIRPWLAVRSTVFSVDSQAKVGKITQTIRAVYRRTGSNAAAQPTNSQPADQPAQPAEPAATEEGALPDEPKIRLTLLFKDVVQD